MEDQNLILKHEQHRLRNNEEKGHNISRQMQEIRKKIYLIREVAGQSEVLTDVNGLEFEK